MAINATYPLDENRVAIKKNGAFIDFTFTFNASNTTVATPVLNVYGQVQIQRIVGVVTEAMSNSVTNVGFGVNDGSATSNIDARTVNLSGFSVGSLIQRRGLVSNGLVITGAGSAAVVDPGAATNKYLTTPTIVVGKVGANTTIDLVYTTTNTPATGKVDFYFGFIPMQPGSYLEVI